MKLNISKRADKAPASPIRKLVPKANQAKARDIKVYHLNIGQPDLETPKEMRDAIRNFKEKILAYAPSEGIKECILAWQSYYQNYGINLKSEEIMVTTGGSEAILFAMVVCTDPYDEFLVFEPFYTNYLGYAALAGIKLSPIRTYAENGFHLPKKEEIENKITKKTRGIIICNPNNPTGTVYEKSELKILVSLAQKYNLYILADETYREFVYDEAQHISLMRFSEVSDRVILLDSISKRFNACGARIGCLASKNKEIMEVVLKFAQARLSAPTLEQWAAIPLLKNPQSYLKGIVAEYKKRRDIVFEALNEIPGVSCLKPRGAFYLIAKLPILDCDDFAAWLLDNFQKDKKTLMIAPASGFYATPGLGKDEIRIAYVLEKKSLTEAMSLLKLALEQYSKRKDYVQKEKT